MRIWFLSFVGPNHSDDNINNHNDDKTSDAENEVESDNAPENNVGGVFWYYSCEGDEHGFDAHVEVQELFEDDRNIT